MYRDDLEGLEIDIDPFLTFRQAANLLNVPYYKIQRAAKAKIIRTYSLLNRRKYVKLRDILERMCEQN